MKYWTKAALAFLGISTWLGSAITLAITWYVAWFGGQYAVVVYINQQGEALFEFFFVPICLVWGLWGFAFLIKHTSIKE